jgi:SAM-dependent methyltransferase
LPGSAGWRLPPSRQGKRRARAIVGLGEAASAEHGETGGSAAGRKLRLRALSDEQAPQRARWIERNRYFHEQDRRYMRFLVPEGSRVLELGCGIGDLLAALRPSSGLGIDISPAMVEAARARHPEIEFRIGDIESPAVIDALRGDYDYIVLSDLIGSLEDCEATLRLLHGLCGPRTRLVIAYYSPLWQPALKLGERIGLKMPAEPQSFLSPHDIANLCDLAGFEPIKREWRQLVPRRLLGLGEVANRFLGTLPGVRGLSLRNYLVARSLEHRQKPRSVSVIVPCRNERGNIAPAVRRIPRLADDMEIIFVEGHSRDGTLEEIRRVVAARPDLDIKAIVQAGTGKADAVFAGFDLARGDVLMILDADLTMPPEQLPKFWEALASGKAEFVNGTRLVYPMESDSMRFLNHVANRIFSLLFSWLLNQRITDTLCGTKAITREDYRRLRANRGYFGDFDPFGDFELIFGASLLSLKMIEIPIRYQSRTYGTTQISRFRHGLLLLRMVLFAYRKLKAF